MSSTTKRSKRTTRTRASVSKPALVRGTVVVRRVLEAAIRELARVGYHGFRIEKVADRAKVNKTTVYRRWPTKKELVRDALGVAIGADSISQETGSLRSDLLACARAFAERATCPIGRSVVRMLAAEGAAPELKDIIRWLRTRNESMLARAISRGELAPSANHVVLVNAIAGAIVQRAVFMNDKVTEDYLQSLIDLVLFGALHHRPAGTTDGSAEGGA